MKPEEYEPQQQTIEKISGVTSLSERQAEVYLYRRDTDGSFKDIAEAMEIGKDTAYEYWRHIKDKHRKAVETVHLSENLPELES